MSKSNQVGTGCAGCNGPSKARIKKVINSRKREPPVVRPDGSLLFKRIAPDLPGYRHDADNPKRLIPEAVPCKKRMTHLVLQGAGTLEVMDQCNHSDCEMRGQTVSDEICKQCSLRNLPENHSTITLSSGHAIVKSAVETVVIDLELRTKVGEV